MKTRKNNVAMRELNDNINHKNMVIIPLGIRQQGLPKKALK